MNRSIFCVLAGGRSSRFGRSKLDIHIDGEPILAYQARRGRRMLRELGRTGQIWLSHQPDWNISEVVGDYDRLVVDPMAYIGPLQAMRTILAKAPPQAVVFFTAADMPGITVENYQRLLRALLRMDRGQSAESPSAASKGKVLFDRDALSIKLTGTSAGSRGIQKTAGAMGIWAAGPRLGLAEPWPSAWHAGPALRAIDQAIASGVFAPKHLIHRGDVVSVALRGPQDRDAFININRPEDLSDASTLLKAHLTIG